MIVATTSPVSPTEPVSSGDARGSAVDVAPGASAQAAFGKRLQQAIAKPADAKDATTKDPADEATTGVVSAIPTDVIVCGAAVPAPDDANPVAAAKDDATSGDAGADLAAQLALVSQWVGATQTPSSETPKATDAAQSSGGAGDDAFGIPDKLAVLRNDAARGAGATDAQIAVLAAKKGATPSSIGEAVARLIKDAKDTASGATKVDPSTRETDRTTPVAATAPALAANLLAAGPLKEAVERTVAALDGTAGSSTALAASLLHTAAAAADTGVVAPTSLRETVGTPAWTEEFGRAAVHVATTNLKEASLRLNPENLGPLDVRVRIEDGVAHLNFQASHVDTRHALEASRAVLDQMFSNQGLSIGNYSVDDHASSNAFSRHAEAAADGSNGGSARERNGAGTPSAHDDAALDRAVAARLAKPLGLVDTFA